jgi:hypothetical protein
LPCYEVSKAEVADAAPSVRPRNDLDDYSRHCLRAGDQQLSWSKVSTKDSYPP